MGALANYHMHTTHSDGGLSVEQIVLGIKQAGVLRFSITDHDCVDGNIAAARLAKEYGLTHINGVELSCCFDDEAGLDYTYVGHIVALDVSLDFKLALDRIREQKRKKNEQLFDALVKGGFALSRDRCFVNGVIDDRKKLASELVEIGCVPSVNAAFNKVLNCGEFRQYAHSLPFIKEGIKLIHDYGGIAVAAHPFGTARGGKKELKKTQVQDYVSRLKQYGADGIEVYYQQYDADQILFLQQLAISYGLLRSVATDFHGVRQDLMRDPAYVDYISKKPREFLSFDVEGIVADETVSAALGLV